MNTILHIDFDSFFASVEQQFNPTLRGKPIGVTAATSRSAVVAASREAKKYGVKGGSSSKDAFLVCPGLILVPAHFVRYFEISKKFLLICRKYSPFIEVFSIDELFMDITATSHLFGGVDNLIKNIKLEIKEKIGEYITVSVGVSYNKMLAKMASGMDKPDGVTKITKENVDEIYKKAELTDICGIGPRIAERLNRMGIRNLLQLRTLPEATLIAEFGPHEAGFLQDVAYARDNTEVVSFGHSPVTKSVGRNYNLPKNEYDSIKILQNIFELCEEVTIKLRKLGKKARLVGMSLHGNTTVGKRKTYKAYFDTGREMFEALFGPKPVLPKELTYVRQISVWVGMLSDSNLITKSLFDIDEKNENLTKIVDSINEKFGDHTIRNGFLLTAPKLTTVPNGFLADRLERKELTKLY
ncbi:MAG TPA: DNA polymerase IV [Patescibacteria group bacterium]